MSKLIDLGMERECRELRKEYRFTVRYVDRLGRYPCIVLQQEDTQELPRPVYTFLENYISTDKDDTIDKEERAEKVCSFLNDILKNTRHSQICHVTCSEIEDYFRDEILKMPPVCRNHGIMPSSGEVNRMCGEDARRSIASVLDFLSEYHSHFKGKCSFAYSRGELGCLRRTYLHGPAEMPYHVDYPIMKDHMELLITSAEKNDPPMALAIALQAYAGLTDQEVVGLRVNDVITERGNAPGKEVITPAATKDDAILIQAEEEDAMMIPSVYPAFRGDIQRQFTVHMKYMKFKKMPCEGDSLLFPARTGDRMDAGAYTFRIMRLFRGFFVPEVKVRALLSHTAEKYDALIMSYEHTTSCTELIRDWFTLNLLTQTEMPLEWISRARRDDSDEELLAFIREHYVQITLFDRGSELAKRR